MFTSDSQEFTFVASERFTKDFTADELRLYGIVGYFVQIFDALGISIWVRVRKVNIVLGILKVIGESVSVVAASRFLRAA